jgi:hypothetical protein
MSEFTKGQPVRARRSVVERFQNGWYISAPIHTDEHLVYIEGHGPVAISDENIQARPDDVILSGKAYVFKRRAGGYTIIAMNNDDTDTIIETYRDFAGFQLVGLIDLAKFGVAFPEGEGLLPQKHN